MRKITKIVVHVSDSPDSRTSVNAAEIKKWHLERGFDDIGYHKVVLKSGLVENGRPEDIAGAHVKGHNSKTLGVVWVGKSDCNAVQKEALKKQVLEWMAKYSLSADDVLGHYELDSSKTCPNLDMNKFREELKPVKKKEYLPNGPSEDDIDVTLEEIEKEALKN